MSCYQVNGYTKRLSRHPHLGERLRVAEIDKYFLFVFQGVFHIFIPVF